MNLNQRRSSPETSKAQPDTSWTYLPYPDHPALKTLLKTPQFLWRLGLGKLVGQLFLILSTTGRTSGLPRRTAVEYHKFNGQKCIAAAWPQSDWYRNLQADPRVTLQSADGVEHVSARRITSEEDLTRVFQFVEENPLFRRFWEGLGGPSDLEEFIKEKDRLHLLTFDPTEKPTPPPLEKDLLWIWPIAAAAGLTAVWIGRSLSQNRRDNRK